MRRSLLNSKPGGMRWRAQVGASLAPLASFLEGSWFGMEKIAFSSWACLVGNGSLMQLVIRSPFPSGSASREVCGAQAFPR